MQLVAPSRRRTTSIRTSWPPPVYASAAGRAGVTRVSSTVRPALIVDGVNPYGHASMRLCSRVSSVGGSSGRGASNAPALALLTGTAPIIGRDCPSSTTNRPTPLLGGGWAAFSCLRSRIRRIRPRSVCGGEEEARRAAVLGAADGRRAPTRPCASPLSTRRPPAPSTATRESRCRRRGPRLRAAANGRRAAARAEAAQLAQLQGPPRSQLEAQLEAQLAPAPAADSARGPRE